MTIALALAAVWVFVLVVVLPASLVALRRQVERDPYAGLSLDEIADLTSPMIGRPGYRVDVYGRVFYSSSWLDDWGFDDAA